MGNPSTCEGPQKVGFATVVRAAPGRGRKRRPPAPPAHREAQPAQDAAGLVGVEVGHRKIAAMMRAEGHQASTSTVERALRRRGLLLPRGFRADRKSWAALRRKVFHDPPTERNRVWQTDSSEFETAGGGIWRICAVIDYATKYCLAARITPSGRGVDALACLDAAVDEAERVLGLDDLRDDRGERRARPTSTRDAASR